MPPLRTMLFGAGVLICLGIALLFSKHGDGPRTFRRPGYVPVTDVGDGNPLMVAAIAKARSTLDDFIAVLDNPKPNQGGFAIKYLLPSDDGGEHVWVSDVAWSEGTFSGVLSSQPLESDSPEFGDDVTIPRDQVTDWMYVENGRLVGGYTIRVMQQILRPDEWNELDRSAPFLID